jgi:hypothetical protein
MFRVPVRRFLMVPYLSTLLSKNPMMAHSMLNIISTPYTTGVPFERLRTCILTCKSASSWFKYLSCH